MMSQMPYLFRLAARLQALSGAPSDEKRGARRQYILSFQRDDGGFAGREGDSDLYYTSFAVRALDLLGGLTISEAQRVGRFLEITRRRQTNVVDLLSWLYAATVTQWAGGPELLAKANDAWADQLSTALEQFRAADGGYSKKPQGAQGSTYHSFLVVLCRQLMDRANPEPERLVDFIRSQQRPDGGFVELAAVRQSGTNPTAAAAAVLTIMGQATEEIREGVRRFLASVWSEEGGFCANASTPFADGLSTFTAMLTLMDLDLQNQLRCTDLQRFVTSLEMDSGGFRGASWDPHGDVEYSFYALGCLALLTEGASTAMP
jgi:geranylgeranyl transferase type-2 subunit beta